MVPAWGLYPMIALATVATVIASQALISGASSLTNQAVQLGYSPLFTIRHTSDTEYGQIYVPAVNWALGIACVALVLGFRTSSALAAAYGIAVTGTMSITTLLFHRVMRDLWGWPRWRAWPLSAAFLLVDGAFLGANLVKIEAGGWFPLAAALAVFTLMSTWKRGRAALTEQLSGVTLPLDDFIRSLVAKPPPRVPGTAVFMTSHPAGVPPVLLHHLKHNKVLHERVILVSVLTASAPTVSAQDRLSVRALGAGLYQVVGHYGFMETPDVPALLTSLPRGALPGPRFEEAPLEVSYYLGRETLLPDGPARMSRWRKRLFIFMARNAQTASSFFHLPPGRVVEMGAEVEL
jgi:KUP system potassium uptake protein